MKKVVHDNGNTTTTEYAGNYIYENSVLKFFSHPEGYVEPNGVSYEYVYQYRAERLKNVQWTFLANEPAGARRGNIRLSYSDPNDSYQDILDSDLTNSYNGWVHNGAVTSELVNGTLRVDVNSSFEGIKNELPNLTVSPGDVLDISLVFDKGNTLSNVRLYFQELDANGNHVSWNTIDTNLQTGTHSYTYTVNAGNRLTLRIDKDNTNTNSLTSFYVDHVSVTTGALEILEENNYYPFGLKHKGYNGNVSANVNSVASRFKFGGKELNDELGLDWYDVSARNYDPALGRWMNIDPLAEEMRRHSPYNYAFNNPIFFIDPDGMKPCPTGDCVDYHYQKDTDYTYLGDNTHQINTVTYHRVDETTTVDGKEYVNTKVTRTEENITISPVVGKDGKISFNREYTRNVSSSESNGVKMKTDLGESFVANIDSTKDPNGTDDSMSISATEDSAIIEQNASDSIKKWSGVIENNITETENINWNPYNQELALSEAAEGAGLVGGLILSFSNSKVAKKSGIGLAASSLGLYLGNKYRKYANHDGRSTKLEDESKSFRK